MTKSEAHLISYKAQMRGIKYQIDHSGRTSFKFVFLTDSRFKDFVSYTKATAFLDQFGHQWGVN